MRTTLVVLSIAALVILSGMRSNDREQVVIIVQNNRSQSCVVRCEFSTHNKDILARCFALQLNSTYTYTHLSHLCSYVLLGLEPNLIILYNASKKKKRILFKKDIWYKFITLFFNIISCNERISKLYFK